jgi:DNA repair protein RadD
MILRPYQQEVVDAISAALNEGCMSPCVSVPTGGGKSAIISALAQRYVPKGHSVSVLTHVRELIRQLESTCQQFLPASDIGVVAAGLGRKDGIRPLQICQIQSVFRKPQLIGPRKVLIIDEAHLTNHDEGTYKKTIEWMRTQVPSMRLIGLSATPFRASTGLIYGEGRLFEKCVARIGMRRLIDEGYLTPIIGKTADKDFNGDKLHMRGGDFKPDELSDFMADTHKVRNAVRDVLAKTKDRKQVLIFSCGIKHSAMIVDELRQQGAVAESVDGEMDAAKRDRILADFRAGNIQYLTNAQILTTGYDDPGIDCIVILRPTRSPGLLLQMAGRGLRLKEGKTNCLLLDFGGCLSYFGPLDTIEENISSKEKGPPGAAPTKVCPDCDTVLHAAALLCPTCGKKFERNLKHEEVAAEAPVMSNEPQVWGVKTMTVRRHEKPGKPPTLRLDYSGGTGFVFASEWLSIDQMSDHYAYQKAIKTLSEWPGNPWTKLGDTLYSKGADGRLAKATFDTILEQARTLRPPTTITTVREGKYLAVKKRSF